MKYATTIPTPVAQPIFFPCLMRMKKSVPPIIVLFTSANTGHRVGKQGIKIEDSDWNPTDSNTWIPFTGNIEVTDKGFVIKSANYYIDIIRTYPCLLVDGVGQIVLFIDYCNGMALTTEGFREKSDTWLRASHPSWIPFIGTIEVTA